MSAVSAEVPQPMNGFSRRPGLRRPYLPPPTNPTQFNHDADPAMQPSGSLDSTIAPSAPREQTNEREEAATSTAKKTKQPEWQKTYQTSFSNGLPVPIEVIVISETPEVEIENILREELKRRVPDPQPTSKAKTRKRKLEDESSPSSESANISNDQSAPLDAQSTAASSLAGARDTNDKQKAKKARHQEGSAGDSNSSHRRHQLNGAPYRGLSGPVVRADYVSIRKTTRGSGNHRVDDDDGHYIIVPDSQITDQFRIERLIGQGTFGKVVQAHDTTSKKPVAVKIIRAIPKYREAAKIELRVLQTLRKNDAENRNKCIHLRECFDFHGHICIVTELLGCSLFDFLKANEFVPFPNSHIQKFAKQLLTSVAFLHDIGIVHTDLKPENILLRDDNYQTFTYHRNIPSSRVSSPRQASQRKVLFDPDIRLIDFGSATFDDEYHSSIVSTRHYRAPEIIMGLGWSYPCDIWSIACILVEFYTGDALFQTHDNLEHLAMMEAVFERRIDPDLVRKLNKSGSRNTNTPATYFKRLKLNYPTPETTRGSRRFVRAMKRLKDIIVPGTPFLTNFLDLLDKMFVYDQTRRITAKEALRHPLFQESLRDDGTEAARIAVEKMKKRASAG